MPDIPDTIWPQGQWRRPARSLQSSSPHVTSRTRVLSARTASALVGDAGVMAGLGSVPLGRWHDPGRDGWSGRCRPTGKARSESTFRHVYESTTHGTSRPNSTELLNLVKKNLVVRKNQLNFALNSPRGCAVRCRNKRKKSPYRRLIGARSHHRPDGAPICD